HDASRPFEVIADGTIVQALGTQFNVRLAPKDTIVSVVDGRVEVRAAAADIESDDTEASIGKFQLVKGEEARIGHATGQPPRIDKQAAVGSASKVTAWTRGLVEFDAMSLTDVIAEFRRYRDIDVTIDDESLGTMKLTGSFDAHDPVSFLDYVAILPHVEVER